MKLTTAQLDRAVGALLGTAAGDALGAPYEFGPPRGPELEVAMVGGGRWEPGEWTDDTSMAIAIAEVAATGADLRDEAALDALVRDGTNGCRTPRTLVFRPAACCAAAGRLGLSCADRPRGLGGAARAHGPHRRQRLADAHRARRAGLPRRRGRRWWRPPGRSAS